MSIRAISFSVAVLATCGATTAAGLAAPPSAQVQRGRPALVSSWRGHAIDVSNVGTQAALLVVSGSGGASVRVTLRDARTGRTVYSGPLAGLTDVSAGRIARSASRRFQLRASRSGRLTLRWVAAAIY
jgi:hypothetical protein